MVLYVAADDVTCVSSIVPETGLKGCDAPNSTPGLGILMITIYQIEFIIDPYGGLIWGVSHDLDLSMTSPCVNRLYYIAPSH